MQIGSVLATLGLIAGLAFTSAPARAQGEQHPAGARLEGVVLLSRHGMRGPTYAVSCDRSKGNPDDCLDAAGRDPWPDLGVVAGHLLPQAYDRLHEMGRYYHARYAAFGLFPERGCPDPRSLTFTSDTDERTIATAGAVMDGMFAGCRIDNIAVRPGIYKGPLCGYDRAASARDAQHFIGGSWAAIASGPLAGPLAAMDRVIGPLKPEICRAKGLPDACTSTSLPVSASDAGPIRFLSQPAEQLIMQYGSGMAAGEVGWGRVPAATGVPIAEGIGMVNAIHAFEDWAANMAPYDSRHKGSPVLALILQNLREVAAGKGASFRFLSSHDNFILNVGGLLGLSWQLQGYAPNQVPLGGAIAFELWRQPSGARAVKLIYFAQTIEQLHANPPLTLASPPASQVLPVRGCRVGTDGSCAWRDFTAVADNAIDRQCVAPGQSGASTGSPR